MNICINLFVFFDDVLVYSTSLEEHDSHLQLVLNCLINHKLFAKGKKCQFKQLWLEYLGHIISRQGVEADPNKLKAMPLCRADRPHPL